jgi:ATP-dependent Lon protease
LKKCGSDNPVILLDEIDKVGKDFRGDPASALLEVLDPSQNHSFTDHYLAIPFNFSKILFIATANRTEVIPAPLLDRMERIEITGYSTHEKIKIAKQFLIPKQIKENGIKPELLSIEDPGISKIIENYTRESGVRSLERNIGSVCRWVAVKYLNEIKLNKNATANQITAELVEDILGIPIFENDIQERVTSPGIAIGMAWTAYGGKIMIVETSKSPGNGQLRITGQLGDVMKESVLTSISWIKANLAWLLPKRTESHAACEGFDGIDLHVHFPAAAVPKDGPSAGITITSALTSLLSGIKVRNDTSMTGEISLVGNVLPIGGVKEKVLGAHRLGIKRIILPYANRKDLKDIPDYISKEIMFITVKKISEVLNEALESSPFTETTRPKL